ncbi:protein LONGIFOLIA 1 isoform X2 [Beta vulgaris subsp. vulgaris]|uniref:protein LONGIFOLIA 1 isoform X2 n=1 Tax=Beta vulgaris subsp. vulgaris TaxID=3555 RepID=UPI002036CB52|nr:protein LONGIFOLIA 1 isoform X2 [Beta vulgaris subsp. vulgaris]
MTTTTGITIHDQNLEKQIEKHMGGCMAGFFNIFDRSQIISGKRLYPKRLPPALSSPGGDSASESISAVGSPAISMEFEKPKLQPEIRSPVPETPPSSSVTGAVTVNSPSMESVKSPWKFNREAPRLSLDSRAITDAKGGLRPREIRINTVSTSGATADDGRDNQRQSPSVIARLMGLEQLPSSSSSEPEKKVELRRSASESRSRDYRFFDTPSFLSPVTTKNEVIGERKSDQISAITRNQNNSNNGYGYGYNYGGKSNIQKVKNQSSNNTQRRLMVEKKSYYNSADFFPAELPAKQQQEQHQAVTIYGEIERRLRMRGIDEPSKDLETLKHILEALQLKGLLHSSTTSTTANYSGRRFSSEEESPVVLMRPARSPANNRRRNMNNNSSSGDSPRRERPARSPMRSPGRGENRTSSPVVRRKGGPLSVETQRRSNETTTTTMMNSSSSSTRVSSHSPVQSPKMTTTRRCDQTVNRSPRNRRSTVEVCQNDRILSGPAFAEDEASTTISESSFSTSSHTDNERWRGDEYRDGRNLLERCDKLLHSIAEITANSNSNSAELQQPSPVSVLDSSFYKEDDSPSPVKKRTIDFKDQVVMDLEDELLWSPSSIIQLSKLDHDMYSSDDSEFSYVSEVLRASNYLPDDNNLFLLLEKQSSIRGSTKDKSKASILQRKLIFDTVNEILDRNRELPPWKTVLITDSTSGRPPLEQIWSEFQKIRERGPSEDLLEVISGVLKKDLAGDSITGWADCPMEMSEVVLDIERLIFKDLVGETIRDLATFAGESTGLQAPRRKLVF